MNIIRNISISLLAELYFELFNVKGYLLSKSRKMEFTKKTNIAINSILSINGTGSILKARIIVAAIKTGVIKYIFINF